MLEDIERGSKEMERELKLSSSMQCFPLEMLKSTCAKHLGGGCASGDKAKAGAKKPPMAQKKQTLASLKKDAPTAKKGAPSAKK